MSIIFTTRPFTVTEKQGAITELLNNIVPDRDFYLLVIGAVFLAACGIFLDSIPVLVASMLVAPLAYPILGCGLGIVVRDGRLVVRSAAMLVVASILAVGLAAAMTFFTGSISEGERTFVTFSSNFTLATAIAVVAGGIAAYGLVRPKVGGAMTGVGIAVSLMPPLVATGIGLALNDGAFVGKTFTIFILNVLGILIAGIFVFTVLGLAREYRAMRAEKKVKNM